MSDCIFCKIIDGSIPSFKIHENENCLVLLDRFPSGIGHVLVIPKKHVENIFELDDETAAKIFPLVTDVAKRMKKHLALDGLNILQNNGAAAQQSVPHFHIHLIPRCKDDAITIHWDSVDPDLKSFEDIVKTLSF